MVWGLSRRMSAAMVVGMKKILAALVASAFAAAGLAYVAPANMAADVRSPSITVQPGDVQLVGRANVHSGGRAGGQALPRRGSNSPGARSSGWH